MEPSIWLTRPKSGMSFGVTFVHVLPPSRVTCTRPSSEPAQMMLTSVLPGASENTVRVDLGAVHVVGDRPAGSRIVFGS